MLKISAQSEYALILVTYLSKRQEFQKISEVSTETKIKEPILRKISNKLEKGGLVISNKGRNGGIKIKTGNISVFDILKAMGENLGVALCSTKACSKSSNCEIGGVVANLQRGLESVLKITRV